MSADTLTDAGLKGLRVLVEADAGYAWLSNESLANSEREGSLINASAADRLVAMGYAEYLSSRRVEATPAGREALENYERGRTDG